MRIRTRWLAASALIAGCTAVISVSAGNLSFLADTPLAHFSPQDMDLMRQNATKVLDDPAANAKQAWSNAKTGASGLARVRGQFTAADGTPCKRLLVVNKIQGLESEATYTVCKHADRGWAFNADAVPAR